MTNIWACFCLAFTASYTANLGQFSIKSRERKSFFSLYFAAAFMITKEVYFDLSGINDHRVSSTKCNVILPLTHLLNISAEQSTFNKTTISFWDDSKWSN